MIIYVEYVIIDNLVIDTLILLLTSKIYKCNTTKLKLFLGSMFGTIIALISPLLNSTVAVIIKPIVAIIMVIIAFNPQKIKTLFCELMLFMLITFLFGGACLGICSLLNINLLVKNGILYEYKFPIGLAILICALTYFCVKNILNIYIKKGKKDCYNYKLSILDRENKITINAFLDSGNCLTQKDKPITIVNYKTFTKLYPHINLQNLLLKKTNCLLLKNAEYISVNSLSNSNSKILIFSVDELCINNKKIKDAYLGLSFKNFNEQLNCDAIISNRILEMGE